MDRPEFDSPAQENTFFTDLAHFRKTAALLPVNKQQQIPLRESLDKFVPYLQFLLHAEAVRFDIVVSKGRYNYCTNDYARVYVLVLMGPPTRHHDETLYEAEVRREQVEEIRRLQMLELEKFAKREEERRAQEVREKPIRDAVASVKVESFDAGMAALEKML